LSWTDFRGCKLGSSNFTGANIEGADFRGADVRSVKGRRKVKHGILAVGWK